MSCPYPSSAPCKAPSALTPEITVSRTYFVLSIPIVTGRLRVQAGMPDRRREGDLWKPSCEDLIPAADPGFGESLTRMEMTGDLMTTRNAIAGSGRTQQVPGVARSLRFGPHSRGFLATMCATGRTLPEPVSGGRQTGMPGSTGCRATVAST